MVRIVKVPQEVRQHFTRNELSGAWAGVRYSPLEQIRRLKRKMKRKTNISQPTFKFVSKGLRLL